MALGLLYHRYVFSGGPFSGISLVLPEHCMTDFLKAWYPSDPEPTGIILAAFYSPSSIQPYLLQQV